MQPRYYLRVARLVHAGYRTDLVGSLWAIKIKRARDSEPSLGSKFSDRATRPVWAVGPLWTTVGQSRRRGVWDEFRIQAGGSDLGSVEGPITDTGWGDLELEVSRTSGADSGMLFSSPQIGIFLIRPIRLTITASSCGSGVVLFGRLVQTERGCKESRSCAPRYSWNFLLGSKSAGRGVQE